MGPLLLVLAVFVALFANQAFAIEATVTITVPWSQPPYDGTLNPYYVNETTPADEITRINDLLKSELQQDILTVLNVNWKGLTAADVEITQATPAYKDGVMYFGFSIPSQDTNATWWKAAWDSIDAEFQKFLGGADNPQPSAFYSVHLLKDMKQCSLLISPPLPESESVFPALCPSSVPVTDPTTGGNSTEVQPCPAGQTRLPVGCSPLAANEVRMAFHVSTTALLALGPQGDNSTRSFMAALVSAVPAAKDRVYLYSVKPNDDETFDDDDYIYQWLVVVDVKTGTPAPSALFNSLVTAATGTNDLSNTAVNGNVKVRSATAYKEAGGYVEPTASGVATLVPGLSALLLVALALLRA